ncbi:hypothetical protein D3C77_586220 [compost metagenome]
MQAFAIKENAPMNKPVSALNVQLCPNIKLPIKLAIAPVKNTPNNIKLRSIPCFEDQCYKIPRRPKLIAAREANNSHIFCILLLLLELILVN